MLGMYGHTWASQFGNQPEGTAADTWAAALAGLTGPQMATGLQACVAEGKEFPPGAPRFRAMCLGIPSLAQVRHELCAKDADRSPFTRSVWSFVDGYAHRNANQRDAARMVAEAYDMAHDLRMRGAPLPERSEAIEQEKRPFKLASAQTIKQSLEEIQSMLHVAPEPDAEDTTP